MISPLEDGVLPEGVFDCTIEEIDRTFGRFQGSDQRIKLTVKLRAFLDEVRRSGLSDTVIVDGSYISAKDEPSDIDLLVVAKTEIAWDSLRPFEYNAVSKRVVRQTYRFHVFVYPEGSPDYERLLNRFQRVRPDATYTERECKGVLRVRL
jgi:predicted nucleotidyltransferase